MSVVSIKKSRSVVNTSVSPLATQSIHHLRSVRLLIHLTY